ncbi:MAG TPA: hypothetical protein VM532_07385, partial [Burkholderiales bacterium]|nr:hypothetical protein [Burkholderiales bacterium]
ATTQTFGDAETVIDDDSISVGSTTVLGEDEESQDLSKGASQGASKGERIVLVVNESPYQGNVSGQELKTKFEAIKVATNIKFDKSVEASAELIGFSAATLAGIEKMAGQDLSGFTVKMWGGGHEKPNFRGTVIAGDLESKCVLIDATSGAPTRPERQVLYIVSRADLTNAQSIDVKIGDTVDVKTPALKAGQKVSDSPVVRVNDGKSPKVMLPTQPTDTTLEAPSGTQPITTGSGRGRRG